MVEASTHIAMASDEISEKRKTQERVRRVGYICYDCSEDVVEDTRQISGIFN